jgi:hypothetical protein
MGHTHLVLVLAGFEMTVAAAISRVAGDQQNSKDDHHGQEEIFPQQIQFIF